MVGGTTRVALMHERGRTPAEHTHLPRPANVVNDWPLWAACWVATASESGLNTAVDWTFLGKLIQNRTKALDQLSCNFGPGQFTTASAGNGVDSAGPPACFWLGLQGAVEALFLQSRQAIISLHGRRFHNHHPTWPRVPR